MKFNPARLSVARKRQKLNKKELADLIGVDLRTIVRWEQCQTEPTPENLDALVRVLDFPKMFFFDESIDEPIGEYASFRSQTSMTAAERDTAMAAGQIAFLIADWVVERFDLPRQNCLTFTCLTPNRRRKCCVRNGDWVKSRSPT